MSCAMDAWEVSDPTEPNDHGLYSAARYASHALRGRPTAWWSAGPDHLCLYDPESGAMVELTDQDEAPAARWLAVDPDGRVAPAQGQGTITAARAALCAMEKAADAAPNPLMRAPKFFELADAAEAGGIRLELLRGRVVAMAGASPRHNALVASVIATLTAALSSTDCVVLGSDMYVAVDAARTYSLPDVVIQCAPMEMGQGGKNRHWLNNPSVVIEVISPESAQRDQITKPALFLGLPSLEAYLAFHQDREEVLVWRRDAPEPQVHTSGDVEVHGVAVPLSALYRGLHRLSRLNQTPPPTTV